MEIKRIDQVQFNIQERRLAAFCEKWLVRELALFGSVLRSDFSPESDVDVLISFLPEAEYGLLDMVRIQDELSAIFARKVDLVDKRAVEENPNYIRRKRILDSQEVLYVA